MRPIVIDTREQMPWEFPEWVETRRHALPFGDYALEGDNGLVIERKNPSDFLGTFFSDWERFQRELDRASAEFARVEIYIEALNTDFKSTMDANGDIEPPKYGSMHITPNAIDSRIMELKETRPNVAVEFVESHALGAWLAYKRLEARSHHLDSLVRRLAVLI